MVQYTSWNALAFFHSILAIVSISVYVTYTERYYTIPRERVHRYTYTYRHTQLQYIDLMLYKLFYF